MEEMPRSTRTYDHFCMLARALEQVGNRWTLLVVRDLLRGPRRFTDLMDLLGGITPKTLSQRLRELEDAGIVEVDRQPGRREVWYRLTPAGEELAPAIQGLFRWGLRHARRPPQPGEAVHAEHLLAAVRTVLDQTTPPDRGLVWHLSFADDGTYTLAYDGDAWILRPHIDSSPPDVTVSTTTDAWTDYLIAPPNERPRDPRGIDLAGEPRDIDRFRDLMTRFPDGAG
jgi:DNA-binding HxlR family transcriptional regulator